MTRARIRLVKHVSMTMYLPDVPPVFTRDSLSIASLSPSAPFVSVAKYVTNMVSVYSCATIPRDE